jgi:hypothetical protein
MPKVPEAYYQFVMDYAPYVYVIPDVGPDLEWGRAAFAAGFAVDFLFEASSTLSSTLEAARLRRKSWSLPIGF